MKIGICDDIPILREVIESYVRVFEVKKGTSLRTFQYSCGEELVEDYTKGNTFDILFLDQHMKKLTGLETAKIIRQYQTPEHCGIVFVTSAGAHYPFQSVKPLRILRKPVSNVDIDNILEEVIDMKKSQSVIKDKSIY